MIISYIVAFSWLILGAYWLISGWFTKQSMALTDESGGVWYYFFMFIAFLLLVENKLYPLNIRLIHMAHPLLPLCFGTCIGGLLIVILARHTKVHNSSASESDTKTQTFLTHGIYDYMRHPIYAGILLLFFATMLVIGTSGAIVGFLILFFTFWFKLKQEEKILLKHFPKEYAEYKTQVKALIPRIL